MSRAARQRVRAGALAGARTWAVAGAMLLLAACAAPRLKPDADLLARQAERERAILAQDTWQLDGRLGVSDGRDGGSGSLEWRQDRETFRFTVHAPVTGKTWVLHGDGRRVLLEGLREQPVGGNDAEELLRRELGWQVPVTFLADWVRGARAPGEARVEFRGDGLPASIVQDGWTVEYLDYDTARQPPLPKRIFARRGDYRVRLSVSRWQ